MAKSSSSMIPSSGERSWTFDMSTQVPRSLSLDDKVPAFVVDAIAPFEGMKVRVSVVSAFRSDIMPDGSKVMVERVLAMRVKPLR